MSRDRLRLTSAPVHFDHSFRLTNFFSVKLLIFSYPTFLAYILGAQKNRLIETVLLSTHNICWLRNMKFMHFN